MLLIATIYFICSELKPATPLSSAEQTHAEVVLLHGVIHTENPKQPFASGMAIANGRVMAIGDSERIKALIGEQTEVIELDGGYLMPGLIEGHGHFLGLGESLLHLSLAEAPTWEAMVAQVEAAAKQALPGAWIVGRGWHQEKWQQTPEQNVEGFPVHDALSAVTPNNPVILTHASGHGILANARAMALAGIGSETPSPSGGRILRDEKGRATGYFNENAVDLIERARTRDQSSAKERKLGMFKAIEKASLHCLSHGITSFQDAGSSNQVLVTYFEMAEKKQLALRLWCMFGDDDAEIRKVFSNFKKLEVNGRVKVGGIKRYADGALGSRGAWLLEPYSDQPEQMGKVLTPLPQLRKTALLAKELGLQLCIHAIGDRANREVLDLYEAVLQGEPRRWRIEHAQHLAPRDLPRFARLNVIASMQAIHCTSDAGFVPKRLGEERARSGAYVWRALIESGARLANGTDTPVEAVDPFQNLYASVTRKPAGAPAFHPQQAMTRAEALTSLTLGNAYASYQEDELGSLAVGKWADFILLSKNLDTCSDQELLETQVLQTWLAGKKVYQRQP